MNRAPNPNLGGLVAHSLQNNTMEFESGGEYPKQG